MVTETVSESDRLPNSIRRAVPGDSRQRTRTRLPRGIRAGIAVVLMIVAVAVVVAVLPGAADESGLTHAVRRGDLLVTVLEDGLLESSENTEIKSKVRGRNTVLWVIESGSIVKPGDELVRLDALFIEEQIDERTKYAHWSQSAADWSKAAVAQAELRVSEYEQGKYVAEKMELEKERAIARAKVRSCENILDHMILLSNKGYKTELDVEECRFNRDQARLEVELAETRLEVIQEYTRREQLETLNGNLAAIKANHAANVERAMADASRRDRALEEHQHCVVKAERGGLVIHPSAARWFNAPEIAEGASVYKDQVLLLMPDLTKMQVKVGVHESIVDRIRPGQAAKVRLSNRTLQGTVASVASVTRPASWWNGNEVRYDTIVELPSVAGLRPGMSAEVEIIIAEYEDVLSIPVAAIVESGDTHHCWVKTAGGVERRPLELGDSNEIFTIVKSGIKAGDQVLLNPGPFEPLRRKNQDAGRPAGAQSPGAADKDGA